MEKTQQVEVMKNEVTVSPAQEVMTMISTAAANKDVDPDKLGKLMDLQERILDRDAKQAFAADFVRMKPHLPKVAKKNRNEQTKSNYAKLEDINTIIDPILQQYGFATATKVVAQTELGVTVRAELWHIGGHVETTEIFMPLDNKGMQGTVNKTLPHAVASSVMYGRRVAICALLQISTGDDVDGNLAEPSFITNEQAVEIDQLIAETSADKAKFMEFMAVPDVRNIRANEYKKAMTMLNAKKSNQAKKAKAAS